MLARVPDLSRLAQLVENKPGPKGPAEPPMFIRCGTEPALRRDRRAAWLVFIFEGGTKPMLSLGVEDPGLKGLVEGVGREVFGASPGGVVPSKFRPGAGGKPKRDGRVPARALPRIGFGDPAEVSA